MNPTRADTHKLRKKNDKAYTPRAAATFSLIKDRERKKNVFLQPPPKTGVLSREASDLYVRGHCRHTHTHVVSYTVTNYNYRNHSKNDRVCFLVHARDRGRGKKFAFAFHPCFPPASLREHERLEGSSKVRRRGDLSATFSLALTGRVFTWK